MQNGLILFKGKSKLDKSQEIVVIATGFKKRSTNRKTGSMLQTWIILADYHPYEAVNLGLDYSICGNCPHRKHGIKQGKRTCYVNLMTIGNIYKAYLNGNYPLYSPTSHDRLFIREHIRWGSYGDPCLIPLDIVAHLSNLALGYTGYTHLWHHRNLLNYSQYFHASVDSVDEQELANNLGWATFRVESLLENHQGLNEITCQGGIKTTCERCGLCSGISDRNGKMINVKIKAHGHNKHLI